MQGQCLKLHREHYFARLPYVVIYQLIEAIEVETHCKLQSLRHVVIQGE
jgi:hypothetical protein